jgi:hypothetical protein
MSAAAPAAPPDPHAGDRRRRGIAALSAVLLVALAVHGWIAAWDHSATTFSDSIDYLFMADFYRALAHGGDLEAARAHYGATRFPPLFPLLLGLAGGGTRHLHTAAIVSNAIAVLAVLAVWCWVRAERRDAVPAALVACALVLFPWHFLLNLTPVSEPLGILLCATAFALLARAPVEPARLLAAALVIGLAPLARTALLPLCIAFPLWLALRPETRWRQAWLPVLVAWLPFALWTLYRRSLGAEQYTSHLSAGQFAAAGMSWPSVLWQQPLRLLEASMYGWGMPDEPAWMFAASLLFAGLALAGCLLRLRRNRLDAWFVAGYLALVLIWPFPAEHTRFVVAVFPFLLVGAYTACESACARFRRPASWLPPAILGGLVLLLSAPAWIRYAHRAALPVPDELLGEKREPSFFLLPTDREALAVMEINGRSRFLLQDADARLPASACLYASPPQLARLYARRRTIAYPAGLDADTGAARRRLAECDYFFVGGLKSRAYGIAPGYPERSLQGWTEPLLVSRMPYGRREIVAATLSRRIAAASPATPVPTVDPD